VGPAYAPPSVEPGRHPGHHLDQVVVALAVLTASLLEQVDHDQHLLVGHHHCLPDDRRHYWLGGCFLDGRDQHSLVGRAVPSPGVAAEALAQLGESALVDVPP